MLVPTLRPGIFRSDVETDAVARLLNSITSLSNTPPFSLRNMQSAAGWSLNNRDVGLALAREDYFVLFKFPQQFSVARLLGKHKI